MNMTTQIIYLMELCRQIMPATEIVLTSPYRLPNHPILMSKVDSRTERVQTIHNGHSPITYCIQYRRKPKELYILSFENGRGRRPRPFSKLKM